MSLFCVLFQSLFVLSLLLRSLQNKHKNKVPVLFPPSPSGHHLLSYYLFWVQPTSSVVSIMISSTHSHIHCSELNRPSPSPVLPDLMLLWAEPEVNMEQIRQVTLQELGSNIVVCDVSLQVMTNGRPFHGLQCSIFHHVICTMATEKEALKYICMSQSSSKWVFQNKTDACAQVEWCRIFVVVFERFYLKIESTSAKTSTFSFYTLWKQLKSLQVFMDPEMKNNALTLWYLLWHRSLNHTNKSGCSLSPPPPHLYIYTGKYNLLQTLLVW